MTEAVTFPKLAPIKTAAALSGLAVFRVRQLCSDGKVSFVRCGRKQLVNLASLSAYLNTGDGPARREG